MPFWWTKKVETKVKPKIIKRQPDIVLVSKILSDNEFLRKLRIKLGSNKQNKFSKSIEEQESERNKRVTHITNIINKNINILREFDYEEPCGLIQEEQISENSISSSLEPSNFESNEFVFIETYFL